MVSRVDTNKKRIRRHKRVRGKIFGTAQKPRLCVFRSLMGFKARFYRLSTLFWFLKSLATF